MAIATMGVTVLDCPDPKALAEFYGAVLGWQVDDDGDDHDWVELIGPHGRTLAFQEAPDHVPPQWPDPKHPQQFHLDLDVAKDRMDEAERQVIELGARLVQGDDGGKRDWRVYLDPAGHPFCLCAC
jgi:catechol 2,3-dioxygenase-like lactoylglutathione lyase family enzyme